jgi:hypothetical protein
MDVVQILIPILLIIWVYLISLFKCYSFKVLVIICCGIDSLFPTTDLMVNTWRYDIYSILLTVFLVATAIKVICKYCSWILDDIWIFIPL